MPPLPSGRTFTGLAPIGEAMRQFDQTSDMAPHPDEMVRFGTPATPSDTFGTYRNSSQTFFRGQASYGQGGPSLRGGERAPALLKHEPLLPTKPGPLSLPNAVTPSHLHGLPRDSESAQILDRLHKHLCENKTLQLRERDHRQGSTSRIDPEVNSLPSTHDNDFAGTTSVNPVITDGVPSAYEPFTCSGSHPISDEFDTGPPRSLSAANVQPARSGLIGEATPEPEIEREPKGDQPGGPRATAANLMPLGPGRILRQVDEFVSNDISTSEPPPGSSAVAPRAGVEVSPRRKASAEQALLRIKGASLNQIESIILDSWAPGSRDPPAERRCLVTKFMDALQKGFPDVRKVTKPWPFFPCLSALWIARIRRVHPSNEGQLLVDISLEKESTCSAREIHVQALLLEFLAKGYPVKIPAPAFSLLEKPVICSRRAELPARARGVTPSPSSAYGTFASTGSVVGLANQDDSRSAHKAQLRSEMNQRREQTIKRKRQEDQDEESARKKRIRQKMVALGMRPLSQSRSPELVAQVTMPLAPSGGRNWPTKLDYGEQFHTAMEDQNTEQSCQTVHVQEKATEATSTGDTLNGSENYAQPAMPQMSEGRSPEKVVGASLQERVEQPVCPAPLTQDPSALSGSASSKVDETPLARDDGLSDPIHACSGSASGIVDDPVQAGDDSVVGDEVFTTCHEILSKQGSEVPAHPDTGERMCENTLPEEWTEQLAQQITAELLRGPTTAGVISGEAEQSDELEEGEIIDLATMIKQEMDKVA
ncbi:hypothetical protein M8818_001838 [Zalaria obscura]|uniref:Uncharacterized protein n=1 Tax=Zalaria obscura TaxID=2024903 RepID=A0ACC3SP17_9PEZI